MKLSQALSTFRYNCNRYNEDDAKAARDAQEVKGARMWASPQTPKLCSCGEIFLIEALNLLHLPRVVTSLLQCGSHNCTYCSICASLFYLSFIKLYYNLPVLPCPSWWRQTSLTLVLQPLKTLGVVHSRPLCLHTLGFNHSLCLPLSYIPSHLSWLNSISHCFVHRNKTDQRCPVFYGFPPLEQRLCHL